MSCAVFSDREFGPQVHTNCRSFDFTLQFEDVFFVCVPSALLILLAPPRFIQLLLQFPQAFSTRFKLFLGKAASLVILLVFQLAFLILRSQTPAFATRASIAADALTLIATLVVLALSIVNHQRSPRPCTLISLYLSASVVFGIARVRTAWLLSHNSPVAVISTVILALDVVILFLESVEIKSKVSGSNDTSDKHTATSEQSSGFWARTCFIWLAGTFNQGYSKVLSLQGLPKLDPSIEARLLHTRFIATWHRYGCQKPHSLMKACFRSYLLPFLAPIIPRICLTAFTFSQTFLVNTTIRYVGQKSPDKSYGKGLIGAWALVYLGIAVSNSVYQYQNLRFTTSLRGGLIALIYQQAIHTREVDTGDITAVTLMGTDVERIFGSMSALHAVWGSLLDIAVASWLLGLQLSVACLAPVVLVLVFIAIVSKVSVASGTAQMRWIEKIQTRIRITTTMLSEIKTIRMLGLTGVMSKIVKGLRADEIETSKSFRKLLVATVLLSLTPINLAPIVTFAIYVIISVFWQHKTLLPARIFTSVALIELLTTPVVIFIQLLPMVIQSCSCFDRIQDFCNYGPPPSLDDIYKGSSGPPPSLDAVYKASSGPDVNAAIEMSNVKHKENTEDSRLLVSFKRSTFGWKPDRAVLSDITIDIPRDTVTAIIGPVGSGKSSLLNAIMGNLLSLPSATEPATSSREKTLQGGTIAYCAQSPWLERGTVQQNILGALPHDEMWYDRVVRACGLEDDLQSFPQGDRTLVSSKGINLSGGQRQRIALARAVYSRKKAIVLDDVFSGMDATTTDHVVTSLLGANGILRTQHTTVIIATHSRKIAAGADVVISLEDGRLKEFGSSADVAQVQGFADRLDLSPSATKVDKRQVSESGSPTTTPKKPSDENQSDQNKSPDSRRKHGDKTVYWYYLKRAGWRAVSIYSAAVVLWIFFSEFSTIWLKWWSEADRNSSGSHKSVGFYIGFYAAFGVIGTIGTAFAAWFAFLNVITNTALHLHSDLVETYLGASFRFLTTTDYGEILNRFSEDLQLLDMDLPSNMVNYTSTAVSVLAKIVVLAVFSRYLGITVPFFAAVIYFLQRFYLQTSRQIRLLGIEARAPLYTHFSDSVAGASTIQAFGWQAQYQERSYHHIDLSQTPNYIQGCIQAWLAFTLDILVTILAVVLVCIVVFWHDRFDPGSVGVSLIVVVGFSQVLSRLIESWTKLESSVGAVKRVRGFVSDTEMEKTLGKGNLSPESGWPQGGDIKFSNVTASYGPDTETSLKGVSLSIQAGEHVAICGRTGSGKTSLILSLLQMIDLSQGKIEVDGLDLSTLLPAQVRSRVNVVPQDPFLLPGTIRFNIDPFDAITDDSLIVKTVERVGLEKAVQEQGGLDVQMDDKAWSVGQKQLLCMARAMLRHCKILILDEATSSLDSETQAMIQNVVDGEFRDCTVLAIMHKLKYVSRYDTVVLFDDGRLLEKGQPSTLISQDTRFARIYQSNYE